MEQNVSTLDLPKNILGQLQSMGYNYVSDLEVNILEKLGVNNFPGIRKAPKTFTAFDLYEEEVLNGCILSYNDKLDSILQDLVIPRTITELAGESGSGKTQVCFQLCATVQLPKSCGGLGGEAIYISTNNNFASHRLRELITKFIKQYRYLKTKLKLSDGEFNEDFILKHIYCVKVKNGLELIACIQRLETFLKDRNVRLIVIDSMSYPLRPLDVKDRKALFGTFFSDLQNLANIFNFAVVLTNDLTTRVNEGKSYITPSFGDSFYHLINTRILLSKKNNAFHGQIVKSILQTRKETDFYL